MTTKEQERKALEQIRKIVEGLGEYSYVGTAMEGVLEVAEQNIEYDAAFSLFAQKNIAKKAEAEANKQAEISKEDADRFRRQLDAANAMLASRNQMLDEKDRKIEEFYNRQVELMDKIAELEEAQAKLELENMKLKAKLYDMMTA